MMHAFNRSLFCAGNVVKVFNIDASPLYVTTKFGKFSIYILNHNLFVYSLLTSFPSLLILTAVLPIGMIGTPISILSAVMSVRYLFLNAATHKHNKCSLTSLI